MNVIVVDELPADLLLGLNFCTKMGLLLDCSKMQVKINDKVVMTTICKVDESYINYINKKSSKIISSEKIVYNENQGKEVVTINSIESNKTAQ